MENINLNTMPFDIQMEIFSHVPPDDLLLRMRHVCKTFRGLITYLPRHSLWERVAQRNFPSIEKREKSTWNRAVKKQLLAKIKTCVQNFRIALDTKDAAKAGLVVDDIIAYAYDGVICPKVPECKDLIQLVDSKRSLNILEMMKKIKRAPDNETYNQVLQRQIDEQKIDVQSISKILSIMKQSHVILDGHVCQKMLALCLQPYEEPQEKDSQQVVTVMKGIWPSTTGQALWDLCNRLAQTSTSETLAAVIKKADKIDIKANYQSIYRLLERLHDEKQWIEKNKPIWMWEHLKKLVPFIKQKNLQETLNIIRTIEKLDIKYDAELQQRLTPFFEDHLSTQFSLLIAPKPSEANQELNLQLSDVLLMLYAIEERCDDILSLIEIAKCFGINPNEMACYHLMFHLYVNFCVKNGDYKGALDFIGRMKRAGMQPNHEIYPILFTLCMNQQDGQGALVVIDEAQQAGKHLSSQDYRNLFLLFFKQKNDKEALTLVDKMKQAGIQRVEILQAFLYAQQKNIQGVLAAIDEAQQAGKKIELADYNLLLSFFVNEKDDDKDAIALINKMKQAGIQLNGRTYMLLTYLYAQQNKGRKALALIDMANRLGKEILVEDYYVLLNLFLKQKDDEETLALMWRMRKAGIKVDEMASSLSQE